MRATRQLQLIYWQVISVCHAIEQARSNIAYGHAAAIERQHVLIETLQAACMFGHQLRLSWRPPCYFLISY
jgi:hypothetical protein